MNMNDAETMSETLPLHEHDALLMETYPLVSSSGSDLSSNSSLSSGSLRSRSSRSPAHCANEEDNDEYTDNPSHVDISHILKNSRRNGSRVKRHLSTCAFLLATAGAGVVVGASLALFSSSSSSPSNSQEDSTATAASRRFGRLQETFDTQNEVYDPLGLSSTGDNGDEGNEDDNDREIVLFEKEHSALAIAAPSRDSATTPAVPPLSELVQEDQVQGDISWMMDFAIIGNPKSGTTFLMHWLARNEDTYVHNGEICSLSKDEPQELAKIYYDQVAESGRMALTTEGHRVKGGLKCPKEISTEKGLDNWSKYFPGTKFIVTTRHPVLWFQSFYNYRIYGQYHNNPPHPNELIGACYEDSAYLCTHHCGKWTPGNSNVCTDRANFHHSLSRLGKTPMNTPEELSLIDHDMSIVPQKGKVFLMEISQLFPENAASETFIEDITDFLDLKYELRPLKQRSTGKDSHEYPDKEAKSAFIDICDDEYAPVREVLIQQGKEAAEWIKTYFMKSEDVVVSNPNEFVKLLDKWGEDPCLK